MYMSLCSVTFRLPVRHVMEQPRWMYETKMAVYKNKIADLVKDLEKLSENSSIIPSGSNNL